MSRLLQQLKKDPLTLIVSLPRNSADLAKAAEEGGADALKVHVGLFHHAARHSFQSLKEELGTLKSIISSVSIPVGIVPGSPPIPLEDLLELKAEGFDFFDLNAHELPATYTSANDLLSPMGKMAAINHLPPPFPIPHLQSLGVEILEAAIVPQESYGLPLTAQDLEGYAAVVEACSSCTVPLPVVVPSQKAITPEEVPLLSRTGIKGIMIGAIVTGTERNSLLRATEKFAAVIHGLKKEN